MKKIGFLFIICLVGAYASWTGSPVKRPAGVWAPDPPKQTAITGIAPKLEKNGYRITPLANFAVNARVILKEDYWLGREADLSPVDLALGWGPMSDSNILKHFEFSQSGRFYYWQTEKFPIPRRDVESHSANMHMIPATRTIEKQLKKLRPGHIVTFRGYLAEASADDGWRWQSSLTRHDTGAGACEVVWVETLEVY